MVVVKTSVRKSTDEDRERIRERMGEEAPMVDTIAPRELYRMLGAGEADILMSGGRSQFVALKARVPWLDINQERSLAYAGYSGMANFAAEIARTLENPVWAAVRRPAPWEAGYGQA